MATLAQIGEALRRADAQGNVEDARKLAAAYAAMKEQTVSASTALADQIDPPAGAVPGSREYADWAAARARAGKALPKVGAAPPADVTQAPLEQMAAFTASTADAVPIVGPALRRGLEGMRASVQGMTPEQVARDRHRRRS